MISPLKTPTLRRWTQRISDESATEGSHDAYEGLLLSAAIATLCEERGDVDEEGRPRVEASDDELLDRIQEITETAVRRYIAEVMLGNDDPGN